MSANGSPPNTITPLARYSSDSGNRIAHGEYTTPRQELDDDR